MSVPYQFMPYLKQNVKKSIIYFSIPDSTKWRISILKELINLENDQHCVEGFLNNELKDIVNFLCNE